MRSSYRCAMLCIYRLTSFMMGGCCDESKKRYQYSLCPVGHDCCRNCGLDHSDCPHTAHDGRLYQPSIPDWCFQRNRTHTMYYPQLYAKIAEETQLRLFFILWRAVNRKSLFTLTLILNFPFRLAKSRLRRLFAGRPLRWVSPFSIIISTLEKGVGQIRLLFLHCEGKSAALSLEGLTVGRVVDSAQKSTRYSSRDYSIVGKNLYLIFTVWP